jgi:hypothetical protein
VGLAYVNPATWALAISLAILAGVWTFFAVRKRRTAAAVRGAGLVLLPFGLLLTGTLTLLLRVLDAVALWATRLVFSPSVWLGLGVVVIAVGLIVAGRSLERRDGGGGQSAQQQTPREVEAGRAAGGSSGDPELDEIEAILRRRGIS